MSKGVGAWLCHATVRQLNCDAKVLHANTVEQPDSFEFSRERHRKSGTIALEREEHERSTDDAH